MGFFKRILGGGRGGSDEGLYLYVRCNSCGEPMRIRVNPGNDLSPLFEGSGDNPTGYEITKEILGNRCYRLMRGTWTFDRQKRKLASEVEGATEITAEEYDAETTESTEA